jgi:hypothetical protein
MIPFLSGAVGLAGALALLGALIWIAFDNTKARADWLSIGALVLFAAGCGAAFRFGLV